MAAAASSSRAKRDGAGYRPRGSLLDEIARVRAEGVDREIFTLCKNEKYGQLIENLENVEDSASQMADFALAGQTVAQQITTLAGLKAEDADAALQQILCEERMRNHVHPAGRHRCPAGGRWGGGRSMTSLTNLVQFPGLGLEFTINRVAFSIGNIHIYWYGVCIAVGLCLALVFAFRHCQEFGVDPDAMVDVILIGVVLGIASARAYYVAMAPFEYESIWEMLAIRDGGLAIYGGIIGGFLFGGLACKWRGVPILPMFDLTAMGFLIGQGCGRWGNFFNQEAFGCNTTLPWGMYSEATRTYLMGSTVTAQKGVVIDPNLPVHPTFLYESIWCFVGFALLYFYRKKRKFNGDITLRYLIWYGAGRFWIEALRTDSLMLVPSIGLRVSQLVAGLAVIVGLALEIYLTRKYKDKPLMVPLALNADNRAKKKKLDGPIAFFGPESSLPASASRAEFLEKTAAWNKEVGEILDENLARQQKNG